MKTRGATDHSNRLRRIAILAGRKSHGPDDNGIHDYPAQARLLEDALRRGSVGAQLAIVRAENDTWPAASIAEADCIVVISDGRDGDLPCAEASHLGSPARIVAVEAAVAGGAGVVAVHFATFASERDLERVLGWQGGAFHWEQGGKREWHSRITWAAGVLDLLAAGHPVLRGVAASRLHEEYYHRLALHPDAVPLVAVRALPGDSREQTVAWALDRATGGREFGATMAHSLDSLRHDGLRTLLLNGIVWVAGAAVPADGLQVAFAEREEVNHRLGLGPVPEPIRVAVLTGNNAHRWHNWPETTAALLRAWGDDPCITARVHTDPADLETALADRDVLVLNWCNWQDPAGLSDTTRDALQAFTARGGGLFVHHFANGACHASLPGAGASDWPWYRTLVRRVWEHRNIAPGASAHDPYRSFEVRAQGGHPLVAGFCRPARLKMNSIGASTARSPSTRFSLRPPSRPERRSRWPGPMKSAKRASCSHCWGIRRRPMTPGPCGPLPVGRLPGALAGPFTGRRTDRKVFDDSRVLINNHLYEPKNNNHDTTLQRTRNQPRQSLAPFERRITFIRFAKAEFSPHHPPRTDSNQLNFLSTLQTGRYYAALMYSGIGVDCGFNCIWKLYGRYAFKWANSGHNTQ